MSRIGIQCDLSLLLASTPYDLADLKWITQEAISAVKTGNQVFILFEKADRWGYAHRSLIRDAIDESSGRVTRREAIKEALYSAIGEPLIMQTILPLMQEAHVETGHLRVGRDTLCEQAQYEIVRSVSFHLLLGGGIPVFFSRPLRGTADRHESAALLSAALCADDLVSIVSAEDLKLLHSKLTPGLPGRSVYELNTVLNKSSEQDFQRLWLKKLVETAKVITGFGTNLALCKLGADGGIFGSLRSDVGTNFVVVAEGVKLKQRKSWIGLAAESKGDVIVSSFLAEALLAGRPASILLIGVESVSGMFERNDVVSVRDLAGGVLGRGEVRISSEELRTSIAERRAGSGDFSGREVIHADYFVRNPALGSD